MRVRSLSLALAAVVALTALALWGPAAAEDVTASVAGPASKGTATTSGAKMRAHTRMNARTQARTGPNVQHKKAARREAGKPPVGHGTWFDANVSSASPQPRAVVQSVPSSPQAVGGGFQALDNTLATDAVPPDTNGAVGPDAVLIVSNDEFVVKDREGVEQSSTRQTIDNFFDGLCQVPGCMTAFDPKAVFDPYTQRFYVAAMAFPVDPASGVMLAVSANADPAGAWDLYYVDVDGDDQLWADYPSFGFNKDWIVIQANMFPLGPGNSAGSNIYVFRKSKVLNGNATGHFKLFQDPDGFAQAPTTTFSSTLGTLYMVEDWGGNVLNNGTRYGVLRVTSISGAVGSEAYNDHVAFPAVTGTWGDFFNCPPAGEDECAPQLDNARKISTGDARMSNCVYRNGSIWCAHTIALPVSTPTRAAVQYWKLSTTGAVQAVERIDGGGNSPVDHFAWPSIAVNANNDALIGFSRFNSTIDATAAYAYRSSSGVLHAVTNLKQGLAGYNKDLSGTINRWGDYSATVVDPRNDADMWTIQEYADTHTTDDRWALWAGRIASASFGMSGLTNGITARFAGDVQDVGYGDGFTVKIGTTLQSGTLTCRDAGNVVLPDCSTGVRTATWMPPQPLVPGQTYVAAINPSGVSTPVHIGAIDVASTSLSLRASTVEQETSVAAGPRWRTAGASAAYGGSYLVDRMAGSRAHFKFSAPARTTLNWYSLLGPSQGQAKVYLDNVLIRTYNNYASSFVYKYRRSFTVQAGPHTFSVVVTGLKGSSAGTDAQVAVDAFSVGATLYATPGACANPLATNNCLLQSWRIAGGSGASGGAYALADLAGASYYFTFFGTGVDAYLAKGPSFGKGSIYIDGVYKGTVDFYSKTTVYGYKLSYRYSSGGHTFRIVVAGSKNAASKGTQVAVDRWVVV